MPEEENTLKAAAAVAAAAAAAAGGGGDLTGGESYFGTSANLIGDGDLTTHSTFVVVVVDVVIVRSYSMSIRDSSMNWLGSSFSHILTNAIL